MLAFDRRQSLAMAAVDLGRIVRSAIDLLRRASGGSINIRLMLVPKLWLAIVDPVQIESALVNFVTNARDAFRMEGP